jgi:aryl-alcohol dehydrogenase-like predicted oxidoreductase
MYSREISMNIALGTVQFGLPYGISNQSGQVSRDAAKSIISLARLSGIDTIDTAIAYGESESCLGEVGLGGFKVVTKLPAMPDSHVDIVSWVRYQIQGSLQRLNESTVYGILLHRSDQLLGPHGKALSQVLRQLKDEGIVQKIGVSIYSPSELDKVMSLCPIDLVQAPFNLVDQRLLTSGWLGKLHDAGVEVHTRSAFLQGLLLMPAAEIPEKFDRWRPLFNTWHNWLVDNNISAVKACISFVQAHPQIDKIVVGVDSIQQLKQLIQVEKERPSSDWPDINCGDENFINPSLWNLS